MVIAFVYCGIGRSLVLPLVDTLLVFVRRYFYYVSQKIDLYVKHSLFIPYLLHILMFFNIAL